MEKEVVRFLLATEAEHVRKTVPERIMGSCFVRTRKDLDMEEINVLLEESIKAKSRLVVQGYTDPDAEGMQSSSPVSATRSLYLALQKAANNKWKTNFADVNCLPESADTYEGTRSRQCKIASGSL